MEWTYDKTFCRSAQTYLWIEPGVTPLCLHMCSNMGNSFLTAFSSCYENNSNPKRWLLIQTVFKVEIWAQYKSASLSESQLTSTHLQKLLLLWGSHLHNVNMLRCTSRRWVDGGSCWRQSSACVCTYYLHTFCSCVFVHWPRGILQQWRICSLHSCRVSHRPALH